MKLEKLASLKSFKTSQTKSIHKDASQMMTDDSDLFPNMMMGGPKSISNHRKSPDLVLHSSKKPSLPLFRQLTFSLLMMVILALLQLFSYSLPLVSCIQRNSNINKYFPYGIYNVQPGEPHRSSRFFRNLAANLPALRDTIPSSSYSKTINRANQARQIQPLSCVSKRTREEGVCMFAWTCVEQGGTHLGTCIDRFYFGSCCKLKEDNAIPDYPSSIKPSGISKPSLLETTSKIPISNPTTTRQSTTTTKLTTKTTETTTRTTPSTTTTFTTKSSTTTTTPTTTTSTTTTSTTTTPPTTTKLRSTTTTTQQTTPSQRTTSVSTPDSSSASSITTEGISKSTTTKSESKTTPVPLVVTTVKELNSVINDFKNITETNEIEIDIVATPSEGSTSTVKTDIEHKISVTTTTSSTTIKGNTTMKSTTSSTASTTTVFTTLAALLNTTEGSTTPSSALVGPNVTYKDICGTRPWFKDPTKPSTYSAGVRNGLSEAKIRMGPKRTPYDGGLINRLDSVRRWGRHISFGDSWSNRRGRIVNGLTADYGEWPWQVSLRQWRTATFLHKCGCALLNENWAITAAHCVENVSPDDLLLRMGEYDLNSDEEPHKHIDRKVQIVASHPKFDPKTFEYDLALLRFYDKVDFQPNIIPICVPDEDTDLVGETAWVTGWGRLYEDGPLPSVMQEVDLPIINNTMCEKMYRDAGYVEHIPNIFICAGYAAGGKDSCEGDSGGPMVVQQEDGRFMLSGVISWGIGCAEKNQPGVYTRISQFSSWINQILQF